LATSLPIFSNLAKISPERIYARGIGATIWSFSAHLVSRKKDKVLVEKNTREKNLMEGLKRIKNKLRVHDTKYKTGL